MTAERRDQGMSITGRGDPIGRRRRPTGSGGVGGRQSVERCMSAMQTGTQMVKLRGSSKGLVRFYFLDEHKSCIRWRPSRKNEKAKISIDAIREVCEGKQSEIFQRYADGSFDPNCCFSIYYGDHMESLDLEADTDDNQGTLGFEEFCAFYKMMSTRRDLYLLMLTYSNHKDHLDTDDLIRFLEIEQKMLNVTKEHCLEIVEKFEPCPENRKQGVLGIDGFTNYMRSPAGDIFNPEHHQVHQDMRQPLCNYFIASSHNTYLMGDQLMSQSRADMYSWVLQAGCRCVEVDCWDGPDGEPIVHHGYTLTSKILFKDVIETINKYAFIKNDYPVIISLENHCSVPQQKKMAQYLIDVLGDKLDLSSVNMDESGQLPPPEHLRGKILVKGKKLPPNIDENAEEGEVSDEDSADEIEDDCKLMNGDTSINRKQVENVAKKKLDTLMKESKIRDCEDPDSFTITALPSSGKLNEKVALTKGKVEDDAELGEKDNLNKRQSRSFMGNFSKRKGAVLLKEIVFCFVNLWHLVALNYQSEGRVLQLNRAKFNSNGNCGYVLKPKCMCEGAFNPMSEDPLPGQMKKQLVLKIISGQQLPKPKDSMLGDRGEIIDPFVEVEIIGLPADCCKEQTRVVDDNGFNPMWEETLVFTMHMPEIALVRFLVWDHDPIGRDFIGQRTIAFSSMMPGYRHVYLEGMEEASIFVHVAVNDITGKVRQAIGIKGLFHRNPKQASLDSHAAAQLSRKHPFGAHLLRRTASAPTKGQQKVKKGFPEISIDNKEYSSEGASEDRESEDACQPRVDCETDSGARVATVAIADSANGELHSESFKGKPVSQAAKDKGSARVRGALSEPLRRANRIRVQDPLSEKQGVFARVAINSSGRVGVATNCMKCVVGSKESPDLDRKVRSPLVKPEQNEPWKSEEPKKKRAPPSPPVRHRESELLALHTLQVGNCCRGVANSVRNVRSLSVPRKRNTSPLNHILDGKSRLRWQGTAHPDYGSTVNLMMASGDSSSLSDSDSNSLGSPEMPIHVTENRHRPVGTLQREMNALFAQKLEEIRSKSPMFFADKETSFPPSSASHLHTLETITEEAHNAEDNSAVQIPSAHVASGPSLSGYSETLAVECIGPSQLDQVSDDVCQRSPLCKEHDTVMEGATESLRTTEGITNLEITNSPSNLTPSLSNTFHAGSEEVNSAISVTGQVNGQNPETNNLNAWQVKKNKQEEENNNGKHPMNAISVNLPVDLSAKVLVTKVPEGSQAASSKAHVLVRRSKSEGYVRLANPENSQWMVPEVCTDVTLNDRLWSKLENHRDSVSSSSSISSSDTVIDLSLPNLAHKSLTDLNTSRDESLEVFLKNEVARPRSATTGCEISRVTKSKSNPNLRVEEDLEAPHNLQTRPLVKEPVQAMQRRHTWSRLFVESLKQTSQSKKPASSVSLEVDGPSKSKSLGDLTSDDIMCNFESKYRSISRSFITRSMRDQRKPPKKSHDNLTEQIKQLTAVEPLTASDFASSSLNATEQEDETFCFLRRSSSRSQSRVRYIANRAKQAQERQRLQGLSRMSSSPIEERGNPEGACCMSKGTCADLDLLSQLPAAPPVRQLSDIEAEVFFMLKL
ncbi:PLCH2 phosphodiesterase, partial [Polypterus senegalus]